MGGGKGQDSGGFAVIARFHVHTINHSQLISAVLFFPPQLPLDRIYSAWKRSLATPILRCAHAYLAIAVMVTNIQTQLCKYIVLHTHTTCTHRKQEIYMLVYVFSCLIFPHSHTTILGGNIGHVLPVGIVVCRELPSHIGYIMHNAIPIFLIPQFFPEEVGHYVTERNV